MKMFKIVFIVLIVFIAFSCSNNSTPTDQKTDLITSISQLEAKTFDNSTNSYNHEVALKTLIEYQKYIEAYPKDSVSQQYLYTSAQLSKSINLYGEAVRKFNTFIEEYPENPYVSKALFMTGMIYENDLKDTTKAKEAYQKFIDKYPNDDLVDDAKFLIQNLSLSDEDLIKLLESKNQENSTI